MPGLCIHSAQPSDPSLQPMFKALFTATASLLLGGCLASSSPQIDSHETYSGPLIAAITPIGGQVDQVNGWVLRHKLEQALAAQIRDAGIFSAVEEIPSATAPNEAEIIIEPSFFQQPGLARDTGAELALHLSVRSKTSGGVTLDRDYRVPCASCALGTLDPKAMQALAKAINGDLKQKFGTRRAS
ncbi:hypothetical protein Thi970DRAFT_04682 [Thiorhodovibrio frisius]|uniref:Uncharacterized protein n=2 Tax=Thiorhodovibrio frisius TaxID=631362 RepID=H8Z7Y8_9GAMM|nr:hypothetical protein Thi970DRAFT_04682 [Thiorhodovibrio frisius]WPL22056.1 hypothetical protein Thiofri_02207 [Thiorhodovibrio frisius]